jgi:hypothetical protein
MPDGRMYNINDIEDSIKRQGKGKSAVKRLKAYSEQKDKANANKKQKENLYKKENIENLNNDNVNRRKCGICHKIGHYAPKCPNK